MTQRNHTWRNRISGYGEEAPDQLLAHPANWRIHPKGQQDALAGVLSEVGYVQNVIVNQRTGHLVDGHLRVSLALRDNQPTIPVTYIDVDEAEEALILATLDPLAAMAATDASKLAELLDTVSTGDAAVMAMLSELAEREGVLDALADAADAPQDKYTTKVETPLYEPTGECPAVAELTDTTRHDALRQAIDAADVPEDVRAFLRIAATRHVVFDYRKVAEFYAHAEPSVQRLMEDSALVIIDFNRAIELGYAKLRDDMLDMIEDARHG